VSKKVLNDLGIALPEENDMPEDKVLGGAEGVVVAETDGMPAGGISVDGLVSVFLSFLVVAHPVNKEKEKRNMFKNNLILYKFQTI
jgi:hypothetical protein